MPELKETIARLRLLQRDRNYQATVDWEDLFPLLDAAEEVEKLRQSPPVESWKKLVELAYTQGGNGPDLIHAITSHYNAMREEVEKLRADKERLLEECRDKRAWLQWKLETASVHVPAEYDLGRKTSDGWGAVRIPDWDVKQKIQSLNEAISDSLQTNGRVSESTAEAKQEAGPRKEKAE